MRREWEQSQTGASAVAMISIMFVVCLGGVRGNLQMVTDLDGDDSDVNAGTDDSIDNNINGFGFLKRHIRDTNWNENLDPSNGLWNTMQLSNHKRHIGAAMNLARPSSWTQQSEATYYNRPTRDNNYNSELSQEDSDFIKRQLSSALNSLIGYSDDLREPKKRHLGAALRFRQPRQPRFDEWRHMYRSGLDKPPPTYKDARDSILGSLYTTYSHGRRYRSNKRTKRDVENSDRLDRDEVKRHIGAALYSGHQPWYTKAQNSYHAKKRTYSDNDNNGYENNPMTQNDDEAVEDLELHKNLLAKRHIGAAMKSWKSHEYDKKDAENNLAIQTSNTEEGVRNIDNLDNDKPMWSNTRIWPDNQDDEQINEAIKYLELDQDADKRHLGAALGFGSSNRDSYHMFDDADSLQKRHLGSIMKWAYSPYNGRSHTPIKDSGQRYLIKQGKREDENELSNVLSLGKWDVYDVNKGNLETDISTNINKAEAGIDKRHLGAAMSAGKRHIGAAMSAGKREDDVDVEKRHLGSAMSVGKRHLGAAMSAGKRHIGAAMSAGKREDDDHVDKRHIGAAMSAGKREHDVDVEKRHFGVAMSAGKRHIGAAMSAGKRQDKPDVDKRHLGAAMSAGKRHIGAAISAGKREDDDDVEKRNLGAAISAGKRHIGAAMSAGKREDDDDIEKRHLKASISAGKRHIGAAMSAGKRQVKRHLGAAMSAGKRHIGAAMSAGKREDDDDVEKRHMGVALSAGKRHIGAAMSAGKREEDDHVDNRYLGAAMSAGKRHIGAAMSAGKREDDDNVDKRHMGAAMSAGKRHIGAAMSVGKREDGDDFEKRHMGAALSAGKREIDKRHLGAAMSIGKRHIGAVISIEDETEGGLDRINEEKRHLGSAMKFRNFKSDTEKRHLGAAMKFRNQQFTEAKRHLGSAMKFRNQKYTEDKRHLGSAMKFRNEQYTDEKRHLGSAMKFRNFQNTVEKRHLGSALNIAGWANPGAKESNTDFKRVGSSMNFGRWNSNGQRRTFGGPFNVRRLNPSMGEEKEKRSDFLEI